MKYTKYPRTYHLPFSPGITSDDKIINSYDKLLNRQVVITIKMDGENCTLYNDYIHARSIDGQHHPSRNWVKRFHAQICNQIPNGDRICGENLYAQHSIKYDNLKSYFYGFSYWSSSYCLDWDTTIDKFEQLGIVYPDVIYRGIFDISVIKDIADSFDITTNEGFVVRTVDSFNINEFSTNVAKWVRSTHVQTDTHWMNAPIIPNKLHTSR